MPVWTLVLLNKVQVEFNISLNCRDRNSPLSRSFVFICLRSCLFMARYTNQDEGWKIVGKEHQRHVAKEKWDVVDGGLKKGAEDIVTFFFTTEFGKKWSAKDLFYELKKHGDLDEIFIPPKRDRRGRRYWFARFLNVIDEKVLAIKLYNIVLEDRKLFANLPRFQRPEKIIGKHNGTTETFSSNNVIKRLEKKIGSIGQGWVDNRFFVDVMKNINSTVQASGVSSATRSFSLVVDAEDHNRYGRAFTSVI